MERSGRSELSTNDHVAQKHLTKIQFLIQGFSRQWIGLKSVWIVVTQVPTLELFQGDLPAKGHVLEPIAQARLDLKG